MRGLRVVNLVVGAMLAWLFLVGCGAPAAAPELPATESPMPATEKPPPAPTAVSPVPTRIQSPALPAGCPPECAAATLYRAELRGIDLSDADLTGAYLRLADLREADLGGANLYRAQLDGANLEGADLSDVSLGGAQLRPALIDGPSCPGRPAGEGGTGDAGSCEARLAGANLSGADLQGADLTGADLSGALLRGADLRGAQLRRTILRDADLSGAKMGEADLSGADLTGADLMGADLWGADLHGTQISEEQLAQVSPDRGEAESGAPLSCTHYNPTSIWGPAWNIEIVPDEAVWVSGYRGVARFDLRTGLWTAYTTEDGLPDDQVRTITVEPDGTVWLTLREGGGAARFDGEVWTHYTMEDGLISDNVAAVSVAPDGSVWFATGEGVSRWDREADTWTHYTTRDGLLSDDVWNVLFTPDGKIWFVHPTALTSLLPATLTDEEQAGRESVDEEPTVAPVEEGAVAEVDVWEVYQGARFYSSSDALVSEDGRLWLGQIYYDPESQEWVDTVYRELEIYDLAVDEQGGMWIARSAGALYIPDPELSPPETWRHFGEQEGLQDERVAVITLESDGVIWFGSVTGASRCVVSREPAPTGTPTLLP